MEKWKSKSGWWCNNHLEKYELVNGKDDIPYIMENKKCLKPPASDYKPTENEMGMSQTWGILKPTG